MRVLAVDTATSLGTVALTEGGGLVAETAASVRAAHGETLLPLVQRTLSQARLELADLDLLAVGLGPGSFTGVRIGVATLKGLSLARGVPLVGVSTLRVIAAGMLGSGALRVSAIDAYKGEVYVAAYEIDEHGSLEEVLAPVHALPEEAARLVAEAARGRGTLWAGDGLVRYPQLSAAGARAPAICDAPRAAVLAVEAQAIFEREGPHDLASLEPRYVRPSDARLPATPLRV